MIFLSKVKGNCYEINHNLHITWIENESLLLKWKPDIQEGYRIELAISWHDGDDIFVALCITQLNTFTLQVLSIKNQERDNTTR